MCMIKINGDWVEAVKLKADLAKPYNDKSPDFWIVECKKEDNSFITYAIAKKVLEGYDGNKPIFITRKEPECIKILKQKKYNQKKG